MYYLFSYKKFLCNQIWNFSLLNFRWHLSTLIRVAKVHYYLLYNCALAVMLSIFKSIASEHKGVVFSHYQWRCPGQVAQRKSGLIAQFPGMFFEDSLNYRLYCKVKLFGTSENDVLASSL